MNTIKINLGQKEVLDKFVVSESFRLGGKDIKQFIKGVGTDVKTLAHLRTALATEPDKKIRQNLESKIKEVMSRLRKSMKDIDTASRTEIDKGSRSVAIK